MNQKIILKKKDWIFNLALDAIVLHELSKTIIYKNFIQNLNKI